MQTRRFFGAILTIPFLRKLCAQKPLPTGCEILKSFDARDWAKAFVAHVEQLPGLPLDEETMTTWFANALMRGYDERVWQQASKRPKSTIAELEEILSGPDSKVHVMANGEVRVAIRSI